MGQKSICLSTKTSKLIFRRPLGKVCQSINESLKIPPLFTSEHIKHTNIQATACQFPQNSISAISFWVVATALWSFFENDPLKAFHCVPCSMETLENIVSVVLSLFPAECGVNFYSHSTFWHNRARRMRKMIFCQFFNLKFPYREKTTRLDT